MGHARDDDPRPARASQRPRSGRRRSDVRAAHEPDSRGVLLTGYNWKFATNFYIDQLPASGVVNATTGTRFMVLKAAVPSGDLGAAALLLDQSYDDGNLATRST